MQTYTVKALEDRPLDKSRSAEYILRQLLLPLFSQRGQSHACLIYLPFANNVQQRHQIPSLISEGVCLHA